VVKIINHKGAKTLRVAKEIQACQLLETNLLPLPTLQADEELDRIKSTMKSLKFIMVFVLFFFFAACATSKYAGIKNFSSAKGTTVVCFGDSLTAGVGAGPGEDYPSLLAKEISFPVINAGVSSDTTASALKRLETNVLLKDPKVVIVELGGNDFIASMGEASAVKETFKNLELIIDKIQEHGAVVIIAGVLINYRVSQEYEKLARKKGALLIPNILEGIEGNPNLMSDSLHPNAEGYKVMAQKVLEVLLPLLKEMP